MPLVKVQIDRLARLARIEISPQEASRLSQDLELITDYFEQLKTVSKTDKVSPDLLKGSASERLDDPHESLPRQQALKNASQADGRFFLVPRVIER